MKNIRKKLFHVSCFVFHDRSGIAAILTVVVISIAALIMAYGASLLGLGEMDLGYTARKSGEAFFSADGCIEEGMRRLRKDNNYAGGSLSVNNISCIIGVSASASNRTITATSTARNYHKKIQAEVTISGSNNDIITLDSWLESSD